MGERYEREVWREVWERGMEERYGREVWERGIEERYAREVCEIGMGERYGREVLRRGGWEIGTNQNRNKIRKSPISFKP